GEHTECRARVFRCKGLQRGANTGRASVEQPRVNGRQELAETVRLVNHLRARFQLEFLELGNLLVGLDVFKHDFQTLADHRRKSRRANIEVYRVNEGVQRRLVAVRLECRIPKIYDDKRAGQLLEPLSRLEYGELHVA